MPNFQCANEAPATLSGVCTVTCGDAGGPGASLRITAYRGPLPPVAVVSESGRIVLGSYPLAYCVGCDRPADDFHDPPTCKTCRSYRQPWWLRVLRWLVR